MNEPLHLSTIGYGRWTVKERWPRLVAALHRAEVELLVDIRHSPCASQLDPAHHYGPRDWNLQDGHRGIVPQLEAVGIDYLWLVELGNPQKQDHAMTILREHLMEKSGIWPVHRGLSLLKKLVIDERRRCCLLCACAKYNQCHRKLIAEAFQSCCEPLRIEHADLS
jgi:hypothetical protein